MTWHLNSPEGMNGLGERSKMSKTLVVNEFNLRSNALAQEFALKWEKTNYYSCVESGVPSIFCQQPRRDFKTKKNDDYPYEIET